MTIFKAHPSLEEWVGDSAELQRIVYHEEEGSCLDPNGIPCYLRRLAALTHRVTTTPGTVNCLRQWTIKRPTEPQKLFKAWTHCPRCQNQRFDGFCCYFKFYGSHGSERYVSCLDCGEFPFPESHDVIASGQATWYRTNLVGGAK